MQIVTSNFVKNMRNVWECSTNDEDPNATSGKAYFSALENLVNTFDVVQLDKLDGVSGEFSIDSNMAMLTDGLVMYSTDGFDPVNNKDFATAHITGAGYVITIDNVPCKCTNGSVYIPYSQLFVKDDTEWVSANAALIIGRYNNLQAEWDKEVK